jgi:DNA topoisomerase-1
MVWSSAGPATLTATSGLKIIYEINHRTPTKAKTIAKFLGKGYKIESSFGHIRDLPTSTMGIDIPNNYLPKYLVPAKAKKTVTKLKDLAKKADEIILASDEDREGEAIAWHLAEALKLKAADTKRIVFQKSRMQFSTKPRTII